MAKKSGFIESDHATIGRNLHVAAEIVGGAFVACAEAYPKTSQQARAGLKAMAAIRAFREELETAAHRERLANSRELYRLGEAVVGYPPEEATSTIVRDTHGNILGTAVPMGGE